MTIAAGTKLGTYEILAPIGAGGMGEVYRARDAKLGRDVALKVLPEAFARDAERMARFQREAKVLASLNHPNIASIYGLEDSGATHALVMELVEGPTLADRIRSGPIPIGEALLIAKQMCDALEYAHERGIVHRDLKPANVKVTSDDAVKVLDFGLAKAIEGDAASVDISTSPTMSRMATLAGVLLGTAAYMSPEQAKGKAVDRRADIWAFGCVLYEMLTGKMAFSGETVTDTLAAVIMRDPDWSQLPTATPIRVRVLLQRCLQKDPKQRLRDIGDARISLEEVLSGAPDSSLAVAAGAPAPLWRRALPWGLFGATAVAMAMLAWAYERAANAPSAQELRYQISSPEKTVFAGDMAFSPDGRYLAFTAKAQDGAAQLWIRDLATLEARALAGTEGTEAVFWSPDGRSIGFETSNKLKKVDVSGDQPQTICDIPVSLGASWNQDGVIVFGGFSALWRVSAAGGTPSLIAAMGGSRAEGLYGGPSFLPDGRHFVYERGPGPGSGIYIGSLDGGVGEPGSKPLVDATYATYAPASGSGEGHLFFLQSGSLMAQAFNVERMELEGSPTLVAQQLSGFAASANNLLAYIGGSTQLQLTWFDQRGKTVGTLGDPDAAPFPSISPDGSAVVIGQRPADGDTDLWVYNLARGTRSRLTFDGKRNQYPVWSPDGSRIAFGSVSGRGTGIYQKAVNGIGDEEVLAPSSENFVVPLDWSRDGRYLVEGGIYDGKLSVWLLPLFAEQPGGDRKAVPYLRAQFNQIGAKISPNGQWLAYASDETGRYEVYVQTFPKPGGKWPVSIKGGARPVWSRDGKELYFIGTDGNMMAVEVKSGPGGAFEPGEPRALFNPHMGGAEFTWFDVSKDGRFLIPVVAAQPGTPMTVVVNWTAGLNK